MKRRQLLKGGIATASTPWAAPSRAAAERVFRWAFPTAETGFDPPQISDLYSNYVLSNIFEAPLQYDYLARPAQLRPRTAAALPDASNDFRTFTIRIKPGILFQDDPLFNGKPRELVAADHVFAAKRVADPRFKSPLWPTLASAKVLGLEEMRKAAMADKRFDYDRPIEGLRVLDRYTFQVRLAEPSPRFTELLADARIFGASAREIVDALAPDQLMGRPVGTGPFRLAEWRRSSRIVLVRNPTFRDERYEAEPPADDAVGQAIVKQLRGRKLPMVDRVELSIIDEDQPRWLAFLNGEQDTINVPLKYINAAAPRGRLAPSLDRRGMLYQRVINPDITITYFNMDDPVVGGTAPAKIALRRAVGLCYDQTEEIRDIRHGSMLPAQSQVAPLTSGYDPAFVSDMSRFDRARARALLDMFGYVDRDGDGWREQPDGSPLVLEIGTQPGQIEREFDQMWQRHLNAIGIRVAFKTNQWPENAKAARAGKLMMWFLGWSASSSDSDGFLSLGASREIGGSNFARFRNSEYDRLYDQQKALPDGTERDAVIREMKRIFLAYMPYKVHGHRILNDISQPWLIGYRRHPFARDFFKWIDIDPEIRARGNT